GLIDDVGEQSNGGRAALGAPEHQPCALVGLDLCEFGRRHAAVFGERHGGLSRRALRVEGQTDGRPALFDLLVGLMFGQLLYEHGEAPRRRESTNLAVRMAVGLQPRDHALGEGGRQTLQRAWRQLLGTQLEQQILSAHQAARSPAAFLMSGKPNASRLARYPSATPRASVRTRRMNRCRSATGTACRASSRLNACDAFTLCS